MTLALVLLFGTTLAAAEDGFVRLADGQRLYYEVSGDGCPAVLVAGGSGMDRRQWDDVFAFLAAKCFHREHSADARVGVSGALVDKFATDLIRDWAP